MTTVFDPTEHWDNLHTPTPPDVHWSTDNVGEAAPGILSPLGASIWTSIGERSTRATFVGIGVSPRSELAVPTCDACAKTCDICATECEKFKDDKHMTACAKACRDCARECRDMIKQAKHDHDKK